MWLTVVFPRAPLGVSCFLPSGWQAGSPAAPQETELPWSPGPRILLGSDAEGRAGKTFWINNYIKFSLY